MDYTPPTWIANDRIVKWRRKVKKYWDPSSAMFRALPTPEVRDEEHILVHLTGLEFMQLAIPDMSRLDRHVASVQRVKPIYIIEGLRQLIQRCANASNRQFRAAVTAQMGVSGSAASLSRRSPQENPAYTQDAAELALLQLQFHHCLVRETAAPPDSAEWIALFTSNISAIPYKVAQASKGGDTFLGNVKTGANPEETFVRMLQEISRVTIPAATGIVGRTASVKGLVEMLEERGADALSAVRTRQTRSGAPSEKKVGKAISRRIAGVFMGTDPGIDDV
ncbi:hypothetical protein EX30DRAFT_358063 [Ascodesmis nigricans]|uniref:ERCC4 domain-containing protein n=1 Tax=Ascodesmis nigricans TaxID=341454 RepID=A0A4S2N1P5_9PEZI|nr:hypothetical protein EX30DRAFT_358063 [Ascodesmis nigricans]